MLGPVFSRTVPLVEREGAGELHELESAFGAMDPFGKVGRERVLSGGAENLQRIPGAGCSGVIWDRAKATLDCPSLGCGC